MKIVYKFIIFIGLLLSFVGCFSLSSKFSDTSPTNTFETVPQKIYSEKLSEICKNQIKTIKTDLPADINIPDEQVDVYIYDNSAIVDFSKSPDFSGNFEVEQFFVYSIVNALTKEKNIYTVEFTVNDDIVSSFNGNIDMTEAFIPDYNIIN